MNDEMRRNDRKLTEEETRQILNECEYGVLALNSPDGSPYGVPMSFALKDNYIYMHCSIAGGKRIHNIEQDNNACFTVINQVELLPSAFATKYMSAIVNGKIKIIDDGDEKKNAMIAILEKYSPEYMDKGLKYIDAASDKIYVLRLDITSMTGKGRKK